MPAGKGRLGRMRAKRSADNNAGSSTDAQRDNANSNVDSSLVGNDDKPVESDETSSENEETLVEIEQGSAGKEEIPVETAVSRDFDDRKTILRLEVDLEEAQVENERLLEEARQEKKLSGRLAQEKFDLARSSDFITKQFDEERNKTQSLQRQLEQTLGQLRSQKAENSLLSNNLESLTIRFDEEQAAHRADNETYLKAQEQLEDDCKRAREDSDSKDMTIKMQAEQIHDLEQDLRSTQELLEAAQADILDLRDDIDEIDISPTMRSPTRIILRKPPLPSLNQELPSPPPEEFQTPLFNQLMKSIWRPGTWSIRSDRSSNAGSRQGSANVGPVFRATDRSSSSRASQSSSYSSSSTQASAIPSPLRPRSSARSSTQKNGDVAPRYSPTYSDISPLSSPHGRRPETEANTTDANHSKTPIVSTSVAPGQQSSVNSSMLGSATLGSTARSAFARTFGERYTVQMSPTTQTITPHSAHSPETPPTFPPPQTGTASDPVMSTEGVGLGITGVSDDAEDDRIEQSSPVHQELVRDLQPDQTPEELRGPAGALNVFVQHDTKMPAAPGAWSDNQDSSKVDAATQTSLRQRCSNTRRRTDALTNAGWLLALICILVALLFASGALNAYFVAHILGFAGRAHAWSPHGAFGVPGYPYDHWTTRMKTDFTLMTSSFLGLSLLNYT